MVVVGFPWGVTLMEPGEFVGHESMENSSRSRLINDSRFDICNGIWSD